jgi:hypothetical protein
MRLLLAITLTFATSAMAQSWNPIEACKDLVMPQYAASKKAPADLKSYDAQKAKERAEAEARWRAELKAHPGRRYWLVWHHEGVFHMVNDDGTANEYEYTMLRKPYFSSTLPGSVWTQAYLPTLHVA